MKMKQLVVKAQRELSIESQDKAMDVLKNSILIVKSAEKTLALAKKKHAELLRQDVEDVLDDDFVY